MSKLSHLHLLPMERRLKRLYEFTFLSLLSQISVTKFPSWKIIVIIVGAQNRSLSSSFTLRGNFHLSVILSFALFSIFISRFFTSPTHQHQTESLRENSFLLLYIFYVLFACRAKNTYFSFMNSRRDSNNFSSCRRKYAVYTNITHPTHFHELSLSSSEYRERESHNRLLSRSAHSFIEYNIGILSVIYLLFLSSN